MQSECKSDPYIGNRLFEPGQVLCKKYIVTPKIFIYGKPS